MPLGPTTESEEVDEIAELQEYVACEEGNEGRTSVTVGERGAGDAE